MSNENERRNQDLNKFLGSDGKRTLKPVERSLYRHVFMAAIEDRAAPDAAHRDGMNAVRLWNEVGAFNEERESDTSAPTSNAIVRKAGAFDALSAYHKDTKIPACVGLPEVLDEFSNSYMSIETFRRRLGLDRDSSG